MAKAKAKAKAKSKSTDDKLYEETRKDGDKLKALSVLLNPEMVRLTAVWPSVSRDYKKGELWRGCDFSFTEWCGLAGLPDSDLNVTLCQSLIKQNIVLPDGRVNARVEMALNGECLPDAYYYLVQKKRPKREGG